MVSCWVRVYEELNEHLAPEHRKHSFRYELPGGATVSRLLDALQIPAWEIDLVLAGDTSVDFCHEILDGERISIFPVFEAFDISEVSELRGQPLRDTRFVTDSSLRELAFYLRLAGFDTEVGAFELHPELLTRAEKERRILLTLESGPPGFPRVLRLRPNHPRAQFHDVLSRLDLYRQMARHSWNVSPNEAVEIQQKLRQEVVQFDQVGDVRLIAGVDVAFDNNDNVASAAVAVLSLPKLELCETAVASLPLRFPYMPGLLSFRETPAVLDAIARLRQLPDLLLCDSHGVAHPRRFGMACHVGILSGIPSIGVAKTLLVGSYCDLSPERGSWIPLVEAGETIGAVVRTRRGVKPVYVSVGDGVTLKTAIDYVLRCSRYRLPEPSRWAHRLASSTRDGLVGE